MEPVVRPYVFLAVAVVWLVRWNWKTSLPGVAVSAGFCFVHAFVDLDRDSPIPAYCIVPTLIGLLRWLDSKRPMLRLLGALGAAVCLPQVCLLAIFLGQVQNLDNFMIGNAVVGLGRAEYSTEPYLFGSHAAQLTALYLIAAAGLFGVAAWKFPRLTGRLD
jgi:hypothetical protein